MADSNSNLDTPSRASFLLLTLSVIVLACLNLSQNQRYLVMRTGLLTNAITINQTYRFLKVIDYHVKELSSEIIRSLRSLPCTLRPSVYYFRYYRDMCFPGMRVSRTHIPRDVCFPAHISLTQQPTTSHSDMCFPGEYVSPEISPIFIHYRKRNL